MNKGDSKMFTTILTLPFLLLSFLPVVIIGLLLAFLIIAFGILIRSVYIGIATLTFGLIGFTVAVLISRTSISEYKPFTFNDILTVDSEIDSEIGELHDCNYYEVEDGYKIEHKENLDEDDIFPYQLVLQLDDEQLKFIANWPDDVRVTHPVRVDDTAYSLIGEDPKTDDTTILTYSICPLPPTDKLSNQVKLLLWQNWATDIYSYNALTMDGSHGIDVDNLPEGDFKALSDDIAKSWLMALKKLNKPPNIASLDEENNFAINNDNMLSIGCVQRSDDELIIAGDIIFFKYGQFAVTTQGEDEHGLFKAIGQSPNSPVIKEYTSIRYWVSTPEASQVMSVWLCS